MLEVTALLPKELRDRLKAEVTGGEASNGSNGARAYASILAVGESGLAGGPRRGAGGSERPFVPGREPRRRRGPPVRNPRSVHRGRQVHRRQASRELAQSLELRLVGLGPLVDSVTVQADGATLTVKAHAAGAVIAQALELARQVAGVAGGSSGGGAREGEAREGTLGRRRGRRGRRASRAGDRDPNRQRSIRAL